MIHLIKKILKNTIKRFPNKWKTFLLLNFYKPKSFIIEPINICNIKCVACPWHTSMKRKKRTLSLDEFNIIFNKIKKDVKNITFYQMGEPLLNKDLFKMIKIASNHGIKTNIATNGMLIGKNLENILTSGLSTIKIALDGADKKTHEKYRVGSDFDKIIDNIKQLKLAKEQKKIISPTVTIQTLVNKYNQNQLNEIKEFANKYADRHVLKKMHLGRNEKTIKQNRHFETSIEEFKRNNILDEGLYYKNMDFCPEFKSLVILSNGEVVECCFDYEGKTSYGNILEDSYAKILKSSKRKRFLNSYFKRKNKLCKECDFINDMLKYN